MFGLDENGWGMKFLIVMSIIFICILIGTSIAIKNLTKSMKSDNTSSNSSEVETKPSNNENAVYYYLEKVLINAGHDYAADHETLISNSHDEVFVSGRTLVEEGYVDPIIDPKTDNYCSFFILVNSADEVDSFIDCDNYTTDNYEMWVS